MIIGIGNDLIEIKRVEKACRNQAFLTRYFSAREIEQAGGKAEKLAGDFAVKEAVAKAFGTGFRGFMPGDIQVLRDELGKPYVELSDTAKEAVAAYGRVNIFVTISNVKEYATACAVIEKA